MPYLVLIKHAHPAIIPGVPAREWRLSEVGRARCSVLADKLKPYAPQVVISSVEPKAVETADLMAARWGLTSHSVLNLHEHDRSNLPYLSSEQFEMAVADFFARPADRVMGSESADEAYARFSAALTEVLAQYPAHNVAVVAHGTVISLCVSRWAGLEPFPVWKRLGLPSGVVLSRPDWKLQWVVENVEVTHGIEMG